ncbi:MAG: heavy-metal-associated domain-containing protein [Planctomycetaceae bacterium]|nr:heavy-metal-associated domain-containing protein [Planctomycetaceae bacterium]
MNRRVWLSLALSSITLGSTAQAAGAADEYSISVTDMHCSNCARKIAGKLLAVQGVRGVRTSVQTHTATVVAQPAKTLSGKAIWEAVEKAGFKPVKLTTPSGAFTEKPKE